jgi:hypothetical protein
MVGHSRNRSLPLPATALLIAAGVFLCPTHAAAGCGDYVTILGQPAADHSGPRPPDRPCHGLNCSDRPNFPAVPASVPVSPPTGPKQLGDRLGVTVSPDVVRGDWSVVPVIGRPVHVSVLIFHPPRSV